jgi:AraC-like DNA-binding protein
MPQPAIAVTRISTDNLPERERIATICEFYGRTILKHDIEPVGPQPFEFQSSLYRLPGLGLASTAIGPCRAPRGPHHIDSDDVVLNVTRTGERTVRQRGREAEVVAGEAILTTTADPGVVSVPCASQLFSLRLSRAALRPAVADFDACLLRPVPRDNPALRLLTAYVDTLLASDIPAVPVLLDRVVAHIQDLVALTLGANQDAFAIAQGRGVRAARLQAIESEIAKNLDNEDLSPGLVAARLGVTPRYVHLLLEETGKSFTQHVVERRLERAAALLRDPQWQCCKIAEIAAEVGFGDLSYFNRAFRRRYGATPSDMRTAPAARQG